MPETTTEPTALADLAARWKRQSAEYLADWQDYDSHDGHERRGQGIAFADAASELRAALAAAPAEPDERESRKYAIGFDWSLYEQSDVPAVAWEDGYRAGAARSVSPDDAHTETVTEWRAFGTDPKTGEQYESDTYSGPDRARVKARRWSEQLGYVDVRVESRTVTTSRRESEWKATDQ